MCGQVVGRTWTSPTWGCHARSADEFPAPLSSRQNVAPCSTTRLDYSPQTPRRVLSASPKLLFIVSAAAGRILGQRFWGILPDFGYLSGTVAELVAAVPFEVGL